MMGHAGARLCLLPFLLLFLPPLFGQPFGIHRLSHHTIKRIALKNTKKIVNFSDVLKIALEN
jgi:hypothetical protein